MDQCKNRVEQYRVAFSSFRKEEYPTKWGEVVGFLNNAPEQPTTPSGYACHPSFRKEGKATHYKHIYNFITLHLLFTLTRFHLFLATWEPPCGSSQAKNRAKMAKKSRRPKNQTTSKTSESQLKIIQKSYKTNRRRLRSDIEVRLTT